jgi:hypothetical protein
MRFLGQAISLDQREAGTPPNKPMKLTAASRPQLIGNPLGRTDAT